MADDSTVSDIYTTDGGNKDEFRVDQEETLKQMKHLLDSTLLVRRDDEDDSGSMSDMNDDNESVLSDNALFRAEVEVRTHSFGISTFLPNVTLRKLHGTHGSHVHALRLLGRREANHGGIRLATRFREGRQR